ncbi:hypothetical protein Goari_024869 [Gossypium aridum]|uniref:Uncharacterized protein n=1 Tax=Gossypium aridum TaxID=34290 RepID=A0A7J8X7E0_GOSAI|nr:hypothetical protein [Gossypium aridum]
MSVMQGLISDLSSLSPFIFLITVKESPSISTIGRFTKKPSSTACKHATTFAAKEVAASKLIFTVCACETFHHVSSTMKLDPISPYCPKHTSNNSTHPVGMVVKELAHPILNV